MLRARTARVVRRFALLLAPILVASACAGTARAPDAQSPSAAAAPTSANVPASDPPTSRPSPTEAQALELFGDLPTDSLDEARAIAFQAALDAAVASGATDAIGAVVTAEGTWSGAAGIGGPNGRKATAQDEFAIASVTKTFTAALIMRLAEQGKIDLDAPLASYLGDLKVDANGASVRQALGMMAGLADDEQPAAADAIHVDAAHVWTREELVARYLPPEAAPGERFIYSSPTYALLGFAAENVTGTSFPAAMRAEVLDPVGATRIIAQGPEMKTPQPWALPTDRNLGAWAPEDMGVGGAISCISSATYGPGAGSMASDAPSLAAWAWHLFAGDVISESSLRLMTPSPPNREGFALEEMAGFGGPRAVGHAGNKTGYGTILVVFPTEQVVVVVLVNNPDFVVEPTVLALFEAAT
jgi:D-alanyl-D-alanine carboxypeptidase